MIEKLLFLDLDNLVIALVGGMIIGGMIIGGIILFILCASSFNPLPRIRWRRKSTDEQFAEMFQNYFNRIEK